MPGYMPHTFNVQCISVTQDRALVVDWIRVESIYNSDFLKRLMFSVCIWSSGSSQSSQKMFRRSGRLKRLLVSIRSSWSLQRLKIRGRQLFSWVRQRSFGAIFANKMADVNRRANLLACYLFILLILRRRRAWRIPREIFERYIRSEKN